MLFFISVIFFDFVFFFNLNYGEIHESKLFLSCFLITFSDRVGFLFLLNFLVVKKTSVGRLKAEG